MHCLLTGTGVLMIAAAALGGTCVGVGLMALLVASRTPAPPVTPYRDSDHYSLDQGRV